MKAAFIKVPQLSSSSRPLILIIFRVNITEFVYFPLQILGEDVKEDRDELNLLSDWTIQNKLG